VREEDLKDFNAFLHEFQGETDRGAALVGAALIDLRLKETLRAFMVSKNAASELLEGPQAPLGTFSSRIAATYALGLIDAHERHECSIVRKIRNEFAHRTHGTAFSDPDIAKHCLALKSNLPGDRESLLYNHRFMYINAVILVSLHLTYRSDWVGQEQRKTRSWPHPKG
jgi:mannitol operon repressor